MSDPGPGDLQETLSRLEARLRRDVGDMVEVLAADVPVFVERAVRRAFERSERSDALDAEAVGALKRETRALGERLAGAIRAELSSLDRWILEGPLPEGGEDLDAHPEVRAVLDRVGAEARGLLEAHGYPEAALEAADLRYRLPAYFVAGHFMKSLVASFWRTLADYRALRDRLREEEQQGARSRRRARWEDA